ncbi:hypothetical protein [Lacrimispora sp.]|uniref:hypothetical protein n=1 Tax=Lacrimispora sp. TaxID=2719234 RepID=UPI0039E5EA55
MMAVKHKASTEKINGQISRNMPQLLDQSADRQPHKRYKEILGKAFVSEKFHEFQKIKYNGSNEF